MKGIKDLVGLLFWMDNNNLSTMKAVSDGQRKLSSQKRDILEYSGRSFDASNDNDKSSQPGAGPKGIEKEQRF